MNVTDDRQTTDRRTDDDIAKKDYFFTYMQKKQFIDRVNKLEVFKINVDDFWRSWCSMGQLLSCSTTDALALCCTRRCRRKQKWLFFVETLCR